MPTLDEIFDVKQKQNKPSLDDIFNDTPSSQQPTQQPQEEEGFLSTVADGLKTMVTAPASLALDAISYLDKPRGAIAGAVSQYLHDDTPTVSEAVEAAKKGWSENTSWKEALPDDFKKEHPIASSVAGFVGDVVLDPAWLVTPAKVVKALGKGSKAVGLTDKVAPVVNAAKRSELGQKVIAGAEDLVGVNRIADIADDFKRGRSFDNAARADVTDKIKELKGVIGDQADDVAKYVEAAPRTQINNTVDVAKSIEADTIFKDIAQGKVSREQALDAFRNSGREIPDSLLQPHQINAKMAGEAIPDYVYRDEILNSIPDETIRKQIKEVGDKVIGKNNEIAAKMYGIGRIGDEQLGKFTEGSHLRRSYERFEDADPF